MKTLGDSVLGSDLKLTTDYLAKNNGATEQNLVLGSVGGPRKLIGFLGVLSRHIQVFFGSVGLTLIFFLILPLMQTITKSPTADLQLQSVDTANLPPPPPPEMDEPEPEQQKQEKPPELSEAAPPLDLSQLEMALNPNLMMGDGVLGGDFAVKLNTVTAQTTGSVDALFSMADLDQIPRVVYQPGPVLTPQIRKKAPGTAYVLFVVDPKGRVENALIQKSTDPIFDQPALVAVKQWKFEPGMRNGEPVRFRMRVPISFAKG